MDEKLTNNLDDSLDLMRDVLMLEAQAIELASQKLKKEDVEALTRVFSRLISIGGGLTFCGVGKSGLIAQKLASTFTSLGLPSHFLHPTEALHGDLGRLGKNDGIVFLSKSGTTEEIVKLIPYLDTSKSDRIALVGNTLSPIAKECGVVLDCSVDKEACLNNQAPTTSSTLALAMGDAMAVLFESMIGLSKENFAVNHPGGILGKTLRVKVRDIMWPKNECPVIGRDQTLQEIILLMTKYPVGGCAVCDKKGNFEGIIVEGDIRRTFTTENSKGLHSLASDIMNSEPVTVKSKQRAFEALELMENRKREIHILPVVEDNKFLGFIRLHDLLKEGFFLEKK